MRVEIIAILLLIELFCLYKCVKCSGVVWKDANYHDDRENYRKNHSDLAIYGFLMMTIAGIVIGMGGVARS